MTASRTSLPRVAAPLREASLLTPLCRRRSSHLPCVGRPASRGQALETAAPTFAPALTTHLRHLFGQLQTPLGHKSDAHESDNVVLRNAPSLQQLTENIFGSLRSQMALLQHKNLQTQSLVLAGNRETLQREIPSSAHPATLAKSTSSQP